MEATNDVMRSIVRSLGGRRGLQLSGMLLALAVLASVGLLMLTATVERNALALERSIAVAEEGRLPEVEDAVHETTKRVEVLKELLADHSDGAAPLRLLEEHLQPEIGLSTITIDYRTPALTLQVHGPNAGVIARQHSAFEDDPRILSVEVGQLERDIDTGRYDTQFVVRFDPAVLKAFPELTQ